MKKVIIVHAKSATPEDKWYPWLINKINEKRINCLCPELPNSKDPKIDEWINEINKMNPDENTILVGHSRGSVAILRWLEQLPFGKNVKKIILVAVSSGNSKSMNKSKNSKGFYTKEGYNFAKIKSHCRDFVVIHSKEDNVVPFSAGEENAKALNAKFKVYENKEHFNNPKEIPEVLEEIK